LLFFLLLHLDLTEIHVLFCLNHILLNLINHFAEPFNHQTVLQLHVPNLVDQVVDDWIAENKFLVVKPVEMIRIELVLNNTANLLKHNCLCNLTQHVTIMHLLLPTSHLVHLPLGIYRRIALLIVHNLPKLLNFLHH
jgi:hypothetical protein